jgi:hypothetical protein
MATAFQRLDADGDGRVTLSEVHTALSQTLGPQDVDELKRVRLPLPSAPASAVVVCSL